MKTQNKLGAVVFVFFLVVISSILAGSHAVAQDSKGLSGYLGVEVNGKQCEVVSTVSVTRTVFALNPALSDSEKESCQELIKASAVATSAESQSQEFVSGELLVKFRPGVSTESIMAQGLHIKSEVASVKLISVVPGDELAAIEALQKEPGIEYAEPNYIAWASNVIPPMIWGQLAIAAPQAWSVVPTCTTGVAVIDTGVAITHSEFTPGQVVYGYDFVNDDSVAVDDNGHGTHVASISSGKNVGICRGGLVVAYKALDADGSGTYADIAAAIISATADSRVKVLNLSFGGNNDSISLHNAINGAIAAGKIVIAASGNSLGEYPGYPARYDGVVKVGTIDQDYRVKTWSSRFKGVEDEAMVAPGSNVWGADYTCMSCYVQYSGTSMASPHVAGAAALLWSTDFNLTAAQVKSALFENAVKLGDTQEYGHGALNIGAAVKAMAGAEYNLVPVVSWPIPWPGLATLGENVRIMAKVTDPDSDPMTVTAEIHVQTISGSVILPVTIPMTLSNGLWAGNYTASAKGLYTATVSASDGISQTKGFGSVNFNVVSTTLPSGWAQSGRFPGGGAWLTYTIDISTAKQMYSEWNSNGASTNEAAVVQNGRGLVPEEVRIVSSPDCPTGNSYGAQWLFNPLHGMYYGYTDVYSDAREVECWDGSAVGMFGRPGAFTGQAIVWDNGTGRSDSQASRLHSFDPISAKQYWLTQIGRGADSGTKISEDGRRIYVATGMYGPLWTVDAVTGERLWSFLPYQWSSIETAPVESRGRLFVKVNGNVERGIFALNPLTGAQIWKYDPGNADFGKSSPAVSPNGRTVVFCDGNSTVHALRAENGSEIWSQPIGNYGHNCDSTPIVSHKYVLQYVEKNNCNILYLMRLSDGQVLGVAQPTDFGTTWASPALVGDIVFLSDYSGKIAAYRLPTLQKIWQAVVDPYSISSWQVSAASGEDANGKYVLVFASGNNGEFHAWRFSVNGQVEVSKEVDLAISQSPFEDPVQPGAKVSFVVTVTNSGPDVANNVILTDTLPFSVTGVVLTPAIGNCNNVSPTATVVTCTLGILAPDASVVVHAEMTAPNDTVLTNTVEVYSNELEQYRDNNLSIATVTVVSSIRRIYLPIIMTPRWWP